MVFDAVSLCLSQGVLPDLSIDSELKGKIRIQELLTALSSSYGGRGRGCSAEFQRTWLRTGDLHNLHASSELVSSLHHKAGTLPGTET